MLDRASHTPPYLQLEAMLAAEAIAWSHPEQPFHSELALAARFGVSRMTARRALDGLVKRKLLRRERGRGSYVTGLRLVEALSPTLNVDRNWRAMGLDVETRVLHFDRRPASTEVAARLQLKRGAGVLYIRRARLVSGGPVALDDRWIPERIADAAQFVEADASGSIINALWRAGPLAHADWEVEARPASPDEAVLLAVVPGSSVLSRAMQYTDAAGAIVAIGTSVHRADRMRYALRLPLYPPGSTEPAHAVPEVAGDYTPNRSKRASSARGKRDD